MTKEQLPQLKAVITSLKIVYSLMIIASLAMIVFKTSINVIGITLGLAIAIRVIVVTSLQKKYNEAEKKLTLIS